MTKTALITGSSGFVGSHFVKHLVEDGWDTVSIDIAGGYSVSDFVNDNADTEEGETYDLVIHAAAAAPHRAAIDTEHGNFPYNVALDAQMIEWAMRTKPGRFVYLSSSAIYSNILGNIRMPFRERDGDLYSPFDSYGETKRIGEQMIAHAQQHGLNATVVRPFSGYGEDQSADFPFGAFAARAREKADPFIIWGSATQLRDWIHIDDIVGAVMALVASKVNGPVNLCTGVETSMQEVATMMCREAGYEPKLQVNKDAPMGVHYRVGDPMRLKDHYEPKITIEEGVKRMMGTA